MPTLANVAEVIADEYVSIMQRMRENVQYFDNNRETYTQSNLAADNRTLDTKLATLENLLKRFKIKGRKWENAMRVARER